MGLFFLSTDGDIDFILAPAVGSLTTASTGTSQGPSTSTIPGKRYYIITSILIYFSLTFIHIKSLFQLSLSCITVILCALNFGQTYEISIFPIYTGPSNESPVVESKDRKANAHLILKLMCDSVVLRPHLRELLSAKYVFDCKIYHFPLPWIMLFGDAPDILMSVV